MLTWITENIAYFGPWLVLAVTFTETALILGLIVPAEPTIIVAMALALQGDLSLWQIITAGVVGAVVGDTTGFWIGRIGGHRLLRGSGPLARSARKHEARASAMLEEHPGLALTVTRMVPFVRTLMPLAAGSARIGYRRFLFFDAMGVMGWAVGAFGAAYITNVAWEWASRSFGVGMALVLVGGLLLLVWRVERRVALRAVPSPRSQAGSDPEP